MTGINAFLLSAASALVGLGVASISTNLLTGVIEIVLGIVAFVVYEKLPVSK
jgi:hypothetical protein